MSATKKTEEEAKADRLRDDFYDKYIKPLPLTEHLDAMRMYFDAMDAQWLAGFRSAEAIHSKLL